MSSKLMYLQITDLHGLAVHQYKKISVSPQIYVDSKGLKNATHFQGMESTTATFTSKFKVFCFFYSPRG